MSNFLAVTTVTAALQRTLLQAVQADVSGAEVTTVRPAEGQNTGLPTNRGVNIFLYQVTQNPHWRNAELPTRRPDGDLAQRPQAALDLHYLLSFYGDDVQMEPQRLLGSTVAHLHSQPLLSRNLIAATVSDATRPFLANSNLAEQIDIVRLAPLTLSLEELSRIWSVFFQTRYMLSVAYQASVVLVEPDVQPSPVLPTRAFNLRAIPLRQPYILRVISQAGEMAPILPGSAVYIEGLELRGEITRVEINGQDVPIDEVLAERVALTLPAGLRAGVQRIQVRHGIQIGAPGALRLAFSSNLGAFVLQPEITQTGGNYDIVISNPQGTGTAPRSATVVVTVRPIVAPRQQVTLELLTAQGVAYTFLADARASDTDQATFAISGVAAGEYLFRVRVDGAESPLELDNQQQPVAPRGTIP
jgi:hypothetical protein